MPEQSINYYFKEGKDEGVRIYLKRDLWESNEWFLSNRLSQFPVPNWVIDMVPHGRNRIMWSAQSNPFDIMKGNAARD